MLKQVKYKEFEIFYYDDKYMEVAKKIIENDYKIIKILKDTKRNYVSAIEIDENNYIIKEPRNEYIIPQRKLMSFFKKGEALTTLINVNKLIDFYDFKEYARPFIAITKRKNRMIVYSLLVMERIIGEEERNLKILVNLMEKIHKKGFYHGDFNPSNFLNSNGKIFILDTQGKKMFFGNYRAHYDMLTMKMDSYKEMKYPYSKNIFYYFALFVKKIKKLPLIEKIKKYKKNLREKGWKI
ncbi:lipopolysaccharide core heptose(II) kinase RfaY [Fusobacterium simiae]|uniref:Lipopolysaccharide biosynthesis protein n=2 Tax=Fusobacterium TaxID=848 RepID=A0ABT4DK64_FUSSI|nr:MULTISPECIES: lipopolysaccharide core heptose(II) kinase RfaY [Fusobacterium]MCY7008858.1 lipopolysaccharide biosynthesis protein [Fusobacterium simiae]MDC7954471.1 lipopolysaccharide core heptose(II) kinase RfaY [Fusobacterium simiae]